MSTSALDWEDPSDGPAARRRSDHEVGACELQRVPVVPCLIDVPPAAGVVIPDLFPDVGFTIVEVDAAFQFFDRVSTSHFAPDLIRNG